MEVVEHFLSKVLLIFIQFLSIEFLAFNRNSLALISKFRYRFINLSSINIEILSIKLDFISLFRRKYIRNKFPILK